MITAFTCLLSLIEVLLSLFTWSSVFAVDLLTYLVSHFISHSREHGFCFPWVCVCMCMCGWACAKDLQIARRTMEFIYRPSHSGAGLTAASHLHPMQQSAKVSSYESCNIWRKGSAFLSFGTLAIRGSTDRSSLLPFHHSLKWRCHIV